MTEQDWFSADYQTARAAFLKAARDRHLDVTSHPHPLTGPDGGDLATDIIHINASPGDTSFDTSFNVTGRLILSSGTHGIEGYAGSAIQTAMIRKGVFDHLPAHVSVTLIHAINPYGFAHDRRVNEDNVDLNRNFVDHDNGALPANDGYREINHALNPQSRDATTATAGQDAIRAFVAANGFEAFQAAVSQGQYEFPKGIFYGGDGPSWSNKMIRSTLQQLAKGLRHCVILDVHTGLGDHGVGELIMEDPSDSDIFKTASGIWAQGVTSTRPQDDSAKSTSAALSGTIDMAFWQELAPAQTISTALEFGTVDARAVSTALRDDNWLYAWGDPTTDEAQPIKQAIRDAFYPQDEKWKRDVLRQGELTAREAVNWLARQK